jgi:hypothetical protein
MDITAPNAANKSRWAAAMAKPDDPKSGRLCTEEEAVEAAVKQMLKAASSLCAAADLSEDGDVVSHYINAAIRLRDLANSLYPDKPDWPKDGAAIFDFRTKQRVN